MAKRIKVKQVVPAEVLRFKEELDGMIEEYGRGDLVEAEFKEGKTRESKFFWAVQRLALDGADRFARTAQGLDGVRYPKPVTVPFEACDDDD